MGDFSGSYSSYVFYEQILREDYNDTIKKFTSLIKRNKIGVNDLERQMLRYSDFGFIQKDKFIDLLAISI